MENSRTRFEGNKGEAGYSWLYRSTAMNSGVRVLITILVITLGSGFFAWYTRTGNDVAPDSLVGFVYAGIGTFLLLLAAILYTMRRRSHRRRKLGGLRASLGWHICFALMSLAFLGMHSFGELNPRSGTYALYGMVALVISGLLGRVLDRLMPRLAAVQVDKALTAQGSDRIETISQKLQAIVVHNTQHIRGFTAPDRRQLVPSSQTRALSWRDQTLHTPWDLAYLSLESTPQELSRETNQFRFVPDKKSEFLRPGALMPGSQEQISEMEEVRQAMQYELFYRYITRYWRKFHILLALTTLGLLIWHVVYALQLMIPVMLH